MVILREKPSYILIPPLTFLLTGLSPFVNDPRREPNEFRHHVVTGVDYRDLILAKNLTVMILFGISSGIVSLLVLLLTDSGWAFVEKIGSFFLMTGFPLLIIGNFFFVLRGAGNGGEIPGLGYLFRNSALLGLGLIPFTVVCGFFDSYLLMGSVALLQGLTWYLTLPHVTRLLESRIDCLSS